MSHYPWKLGVITDQVDLNLDRTLNKFIPRYGLRWVELRYLNLGGRKSYVYAEATSVQLKQIRHRMDNAGVTLSVLDTAVYKNTLPGTRPVDETPAYVSGVPTALEHQLEALRRAAEAAHVLGADRVRIFTFRRVAQPDTVFNRVVDELHKALRVAEEHDVRLLVENEYDCNTGTGEEIVRLFRAVADRRLLHNWDPCNAYEMGEQPFPKVWNQLDHGRISHIHLKDASGTDWRPVGAGNIDFEGQFAALKAVEYTGTMSLETRYQRTGEDQFASSVESMNGLVAVLSKN